MPLVATNVGPQLSTEQENDGWSTTTKVAVGAACLALGYVAFRAATVSVLPPSPSELTYLLNPVNKFSVGHVSIMRRLAEACGSNVDKMMKMIEPYALKLSEIQMSTLFPPTAAGLPATTEFSMTATYPSASGQLLNSTISMFKSGGAKLWDAARLDTIRAYCVENVFPVLRQMFTDFISYANKGLNDTAIFEIMSAPAYGFEVDPVAIAPAVARLAI